MQTYQQLESDAAKWNSAIFRHKKKKKHCSNPKAAKKFHAFTVSPKSATASRGELLAGRLLFSPGTHYLIISPCRCSGRGQQSVTVASLYSTCLPCTYGAGNRCQMPQSPQKPPHISFPITVTACSGPCRHADLSKWTWAKSIRNNMNIIYTVVAHLSQNNVCL